MQLTDHHIRILVESVADYAIFLLDPDGVVQSWNLGARARSPQTEPRDVRPNQFTGSLPV